MENLKENLKVLEESLVEINEEMKKDLPPHEQEQLGFLKGMVTSQIKRQKEFIEKMSSLEPKT